jgi:hypothetical protein
MTLKNWKVVEIGIRLISAFIEVRFWNSLSVSIKFLKSFSFHFDKYLQEQMKVFSKYQAREFGRFMDHKKNTS